MSRFKNLEFDRDDEAHRGLSEQVHRGGDVIDAQHHFREAQERFHEGRFEKALRSYGRALEHNAAMAEAWVGQVRSLLELGDAKEARLWADKALELFRDHPELIAAKSVALAREGCLMEAMKVSDAALSQKGESPYVWQARGEVLLARGQRNEDFCFAKAVELAPKDWFERVVIARIYRLYKLTAVALKWLHDALALHASSAFLWVQIGECQAALGITAEARGSLINALAIDSDCPGARTALNAVDSEPPSRKIWRTITRFFGRHDGR